MTTLLVRSVAAVPLTGVVRVDDPAPGQHSALVVDRSPALGVVFRRGVVAGVLFGGVIVVATVIGRLVGESQNSVRTRLRPALPPRPS